MSCARCQGELSPKQLNDLIGITGLPVQQLEELNLKLYCDRCKRFRKKKNNRLGYAILMLLLLAAIFLWIF